MWNDTTFYPKGSDFIGAASSAAPLINYPGINDGGYQTISFKPLCGLLNQPLYLPLCFSSNGLVLEFELVSNGADAVIGQNTNPANVAVGSTFFQCIKHEYILDHIRFSRSRRYYYPRQCIAKFL